MAPNPQPRTNEHIITLLVENRPGVLARCVGLFARRGYNISSLTVSVTEDPTLSRVTLTVSGDNSTLEQINKQLYKLIDVIHVVDYTETPALQRELALIKVRAADMNSRAEIKQFAEVFRGQIVDVSERSFTIEVTGDSDKIDALERLLEPYGILEMVRTGAVVISRGPQTAANPTGASENGSGSVDAEPKVVTAGRA